MSAAARSGAPKLLGAAIWYTRNGYHVFACAPREKAPATKRGLRDATTDPGAIGRMWSEPSNNVAIACGPSSIVVIDVDGDEGEASLAELQRMHGPLPVTCEALTGRGRHLYFKAAQRTVRNSAGKLGPGLDVRAEGGYVIAPPSIHPDGSVYRWADGRRPDQRPPVELPEWLLGLLAPERPERVSEARTRPLGLIAHEDAYGRAALERERLAVQSAPEGTRNARLNEAAFSLGQLVAGGELPEQPTRDALLEAAERAGLSQREAIKTVLSGMVAGQREPRTAPERPQSNGHAVHAPVHGEAARQIAAGPNPPRPVLVSIADVQPERVRWLWPDRIPLGKLTVLDGDPGLGKSLISLDLAARVSIGAVMPDGAASDLHEPAGVVLLSAEDDPADTLRPRLDAAGADVSRIAALTAIQSGDVEVFPSLDALAELEQAIEQRAARLVVIDPLMAYLPSATDSHRDQDIRSLLAPLSQLAARTGVAIVIVRHLNKRSGGNPLYRGGGSIGIVGAARSGLLVARDPDDPDGGRRILAVTKSNLAAEAPALAYRIDSSGSAPRVAWEGPTEHTAAQLVVERSADGDGGAIAEARDFLTAELADGPVKAKDIRQRARQAGIADRTLDRAKAMIGARAMKSGQPGSAGQVWLWWLPESKYANAASKSASNDGLALFDEAPGKTREVADTLPKCANHARAGALRATDGALRAGEGSEIGEL